MVTFCTSHETVLSLLLAGNTWRNQRLRLLRDYAGFQRLRLLRDYAGFQRLRLLRDYAG